MPSTSESQRRAAAVALAAKRGTYDPAKLEGASKSMYESMNVDDLIDFAKSPFVQRLVRTREKVKKRK